VHPRLGGEKKRKRTPHSKTEWPGRSAQFGVELSSLLGFVFTHNED